MGTVVHGREKIGSVRKGIQNGNWTLMALIESIKTLRGTELTKRLWPRGSWNAAPYYKMGVPYKPSQMNPGLLFSCPKYRAKGAFGGGGGVELGKFYGIFGEKRRTAHVCPFLRSKQLSGEVSQTEAPRFRQFTVSLSARTWRSQQVQEYREVGPQREGYIWRVAFRGEG